jgi:type I restriction enzyme, S subunit
VKAGWRTATLGEALAVVRNGLNCKQVRDGEGDPISRIETIADGTFNFSKVGRSMLSAKERANFRLVAGDVLFSHINSPPHVGKTALLDTDEEIYHGVNLLLLRPVEGVDPRYLQAYLIYLHGHGYWRTRCKQSVNQASVNQTDLKRAPFAYPPLGEQKQVVAVLDEAFEGLARARENAEANLQNARELFDSVLEGIVEADNLRYGVTQVADVASEVTDGDHSPPPKAETGIPFITISDIRKDDRDIDFADTFNVPISYYDALKDKRQPRRGDILYTVTGATLGIPILVEDDRKFCFQRHIALVRAKSVIDSRWLSYMMMSRFVFDQATRGATGAAQKTVPLKILREIRIPNTPTGTQRLVADMLENVWGQTRKLQKVHEKKVDDLIHLRQSLLQKAFAGELT